MMSVAGPILRAVAHEFNARISEVTSGRKIGPLARARFVVALLLRWRGFSYPDIGWVLGRRDHSTAIHAVRRAQGDEELLLLAARMASGLGVQVPPSRVEALS